MTTRPPAPAFFVPDGRTFTPLLGAQRDLDPGPDLALDVEVAPTSSRSTTDTPTTSTPSTRRGAEFTVDVMRRHDVDQQA